MKGFVPLVLGIFGMLAFSWTGLTLVPSMQIGHIDPQMDEDGNDAYPAPRSGMAERGRRVYVSNGCVYCHSQQIRPDYLASDVDRKWGQRRSAPRDYLFDRPVLLGKMRMGPDLSNVGKRAPVEDENAPASNGPAAASPAPQGNIANANTQPAPPAGKPPAPAAAPSPPAASSPAAPANVAKSNSQSSQPATSTAPPAAVANAAPAAASPSASPAAAQPANPAVAAATSADTSQGDAGPPPYSAVWHHQHLYAPRSVTQDSNMPAFRFLYSKRRIEGEPAADALKISGDAAAPSGYEIVPTYDAQCLVAYLMSLDQSHPLKEVKSDTPVSPPAPAKAVK